MDSIIPSILNIGFLIIAGLTSILAALTIYIYIRYGRRRSLTVFSSLVFIVIYFTMLTAAYATLQNVIEFYVS